MTETMERVTEMLRQTDAKLKKLGVVPYGVRKATPKEEKARFENLDVHGLTEMLGKEGKEKTNKWLGKYMSRGGGS